MYGHQVTSQATATLISASSLAKEWPMLESRTPHELQVAII